MLDDDDGSLAQVDNRGRLVFRPSESETDEVLQARSRLAHATSVARPRAQSAAVQTSLRGSKTASESMRPASAASAFYMRPDPFALLHDKYSGVLSGKAAQPSYPLSKYEKWLGIGRIKLHSLETLNRLQEDLKGQDIPEEFEEYLHNTRYLLSKVDKACKMLMRLASEKDGNGQGNVFAGQTQIACRDLTIDLGESLPQLISQVAMYQDALCSTDSKFQQARRECEELHKKNGELKELCSKERRQKEFFQQKRKVELGEAQQKRSLGFETKIDDEDPFDMLNSSGKDLDMLVYSERDLAAKKQEWMRKSQAQFDEEKNQLDADWAKKCELERKRATEDLENQRQQYLKTIDELRAKLGALSGEPGISGSAGPYGTGSPQQLGSMGQYGVGGGAYGGDGRGSLPFEDTTQLAGHHSSGQFPGRFQQPGSQGFADVSASKGPTTDPCTNALTPNSSDGGAKDKGKKDGKSKKAEFSAKSSAKGAAGQPGGTAAKPGQATNKENAAPSGSEKDPVWSEVRAVEGGRSPMHSSQGGIHVTCTGGSSAFGGASQNGYDPSDSFASALFSMRLLTLQNAFQKLMGRMQDGEYASSVYGVEDLKGSVEAVLHEAGKELHVKVIRMFEQARAMLKRAEGSATCISKESTAEEMQQLRSALMMPEAGTAAMKVDGANHIDLQRRLEGRQQAMVEANDRWLQQVLGELGLKTEFDRTGIITEDDIGGLLEGGFGDQTLRGSRATTPGGTQRNARFEAGLNGSSSRILDASEYGEDLNDSGYRQVVKGLRRRIFEEIMAEERERMTKRAEEELITKCEVGGMGELARLVRRVEDLTLRRDLCRALKDYGRRLPSTIEVVCKFCRRKVKKEHVHSYDAPNSSALMSELGRPQSSPGLSRNFTSPDLTLDQSRQSDISGSSALNKSTTLSPSHLLGQATLLPPGHPNSFGLINTVGTSLKTPSGAA